MVVAARGAGHDLHADRLEALHDPLLRFLVGLVVEWDRRHRRSADHVRRPPGRALDVAADAVRVLAVEDALRGHRAERPDERADLLVAPAREALLLLERLMVSERLAAPADRDARRLARRACTRELRRRGPPRGSRPRASRRRRTRCSARCRTRRVAIASTRSSQANRSRPEWCAYVSAIEQTCSIIAGE